MQSGLQPDRQKTSLSTAAQDGELTETQGGKPPKDISPANKGFIMMLVGFEMMSIKMTTNCLSGGWERSKKAGRQ